MTSIKQKLKNAIDRAQLSGSAKAVLSSKLTYLAPARLTRLERALSSVIAEKVSGDVLEFGVALGGSAVLLAKHATRAGKRFAGFDVFAMIPPPASEKDDAKSKERYAVIASGKSSGIAGDSYYGYRDDLLCDVSRSLAEHGVEVDGDKVMLVKGLFEETWPNYKTSGVCFAHIDCDWYDPVKFCLDAMRNKLSTGGIIVLDDYHDYGGCRTATDEFLAANPSFRFEDGPNPIIRRG
jgi:O-methyltransferase